MAKSKAKGEDAPSEEGAEAAPAKRSRAKADAPAKVEAAAPATEGAAEAEPAKAKRPRKAKKAEAAEAAAPAAAGADAGPERHPTERLHKFLASSGAGSRREAETFIAQGRVSVNGTPITKMGFKIDPAVDTITLDGEPMKAETKVYFLVHKPAGFICTNHDEKGRPRAIDLLRGVQQRIYTVGRLDADSLGLILVTNDGALANVVCHPRYRIEKRYQVAVKGFIEREQITRLEAGVWLAEGKSSPAKVVPLGRNPRRNETILEMTVFEGRNREIRRVFAKVGLIVRRLLRISIGPLELRGLQPGEARSMTRDELKFVDDARTLYEANKAAWDAEFPAPEKPVWRPRRPKKKQGGGRPRRGGGGGGGFRGGGGGGGGGGRFGGRPRFGDRPGFGGGRPRFGDRPGFGDRPAYGDRPGFRRPVRDIFDDPPRPPPEPPRGPGGPGSGPGGPPNDPTRPRRYY